MQIKKSRVLITGAGGFIGSHLTEELVKIGAEVKALVHYNSRNDWGKLEELPEDILSELEVVSGDIRDPFFVQKITKNVDVVFHLAAAIAIPFSYTAPYHYAETNIIGTLNILHACHINRVKKIVHTSTSEVYGTAKYVPIDENHPLQGQSPYSASKIAADKIAESFFCSFNLPVAIIRPFNTFGPRQSARAIIPSVISQIISGRKKIKAGSLEPVRDFTYVKDTVEGFIKIAQSDETAGEVINIGNGKGTTIKELICLITELTGRKIPISKDVARIRPPNSEVMKLICANEKAKRLLKWSPAYSLQEGLKETIRYIKDNLEKYKSEIYNL